ncbi:MAG: hypothetical protein O2999_03100 [Nitrospirae bacterium]|nr:hypothetical protein [Nitrospirota bacterium]MDA1303278.1 hypothetical protein [Nitrospirota bacterium]
MRLRWANLNEQDRAAVSATVAFLNGRLEDRATIDWALGLKPNDTVKRFALLELIDGLGRRKIKEPWQFAWRLIEESWNNVAVEDYASTAVYGAQRRLRAGDKSGSLVTEIVELVAPRIKVEPFSRLGLYFQKPSKRPKKVGDLFSTGLTSGSIVDPGLLNFEVLTDPSFLASLAHALDAAVVNGLDIARRIGCEGERHLWQLGQLNRVYYVPVAERPDEQEPDEFHRGIAPSVKLLYAVVLRLVSIDLPRALDFVCRWKLLGSPVYLRLWAALSRDPLITPANEVGAFLLSFDDRRFWDLHDFPEITELRAKRFSEFDPQDQIALMARIRKLPPRNRWPRKADLQEIKSA